jgi:putative transposase
MAGAFRVIYDASAICIGVCKNIELNPVRAGLVKTPEAWRLSSAGPHIEGRDDLLVETKPLGAMVQKTWREFLAQDVSQPDMERFRKHERTGRPLGEDAFIEEMEHLLDRRLRPQKPGPKKEKDK